MKDLKRQLKLERKKTEQLQQRLQEACSENRARESKSLLIMVGSLSYAAAKMSNYPLYTTKKHKI